MKFEFAGEKPDGYFVKKPYWKLIENSGKYLVSQKGEILRLPFYQKGKMEGSYYYRDFRIAKPGLNSSGYPKFNINYNGVKKTNLIHRLVAKAFISNPDPKNKLQINHKNGIKTDNTINNLEWCTHAENQRHAVETGLLNKSHFLKSSLAQRKKEDHYPYHQFEGPRKLTDDDVRYIRSNGNNMTYTEIAEKIGCTRKTVANCFNGRFYQDIE